MLYLTVRTGISTEADTLPKFFYFVFIKNYFIKNRASVDKGAAQYSYIFMISVTRWHCVIKVTQAVRLPLSRHYRGQSGMPTRDNLSTAIFSIFRHYC